MQGKSIKRNLIIYSFKILIMSIFPIIIFPYSSRILGVEEIGKIQYAYSIAGYFQMFSALGIFSYGVREGNKRKDNEDEFSRFTKEIMIINLISSVVSGMVYVIIIYTSSKLMAYRIYLLVFIFYVVIGGWSTDWVANVYEDFKYITVRAVILQSFAAVIALWGINTVNDGLVYAVILIFSIVFSNLFNLVYIKKKIVKKKDKLELKSHISGIVYLFAILLAGNIYSLLDTTIIGFLRGDVEVGLYTAASKYTRLVVQFLAAISTVFLSRLTYLVTKNRMKEFERLFNKATQIVLWVAIPCAVGIATLSEEIILVFSGAEFLLANDIMKILAIDIIFSAIDGFLGWHILVPLHKEKYLLGATICGAAIDVILNVIFIPMWGAEGAAIATLISELIVFTVCFSVCKKMVSMKEIYASGIKYLLASIPIVFINRHINTIGIEYNIMKIGIVVVLSLMEYILLLLLMKERLTVECLISAIRGIKRGYEHV